jgi:peroxiredoxin
MRTTTIVLMLGQIFLAGAATAQEPAGKSQNLTFSLPGQSQASLQDHLGHVVALEFINTKCSHCQAASKVMNKLQRRFVSGGFQAIEIAINDDAPSLVQKFAADRHLTFPVGWTTYDQMLVYLGFNGRAVLPQLVLIDRVGAIHYRTAQKGDEPALEEDTIAARIQELTALGASTKNSGPPGDPKAGRGY